MTEAEMKELQDLRDLLYEIERWNAKVANSQYNGDRSAPWVGQMLEKARLQGVIRWPRP